MGQNFTRKLDQKLTRKLDKNYWKIGQKFTRK